VRIPKRSFGESPKANKLINNKGIRKKKTRKSIGKASIKLLDTFSFIEGFSSFLKF